VIRYTPIICILFLTSVDLSSQEYNVLPHPKSLTHNEFVGGQFDNKLLICSDKKNDFTVTHLDENAKHLIDIYSTYQDTSGLWTKLELFSSGLRSILHDGPITFYPDSMHGICSRNIYLPKQLSDDNRDNILGLYEVSYDGTDWQYGELIFKEDTSYTFTHPSLNKDGDILFFSANLPGGYGGYDLYFSKKVNGKWTEPTNMGEKVNTKFNEIFPHINAIDQLYFSSDRRESFGLDIYTINYSNIEKKEAVLLPEPINSYHDDFAFITDKFGFNGYFSSNRNGTDDVFLFQKDIPVFSNCDSLIQPEDFCYEFFEEGTFKLDTLPLMYEWDFGDGTKKRGLIVDHCFEKEGFYEVQLNIVDTILNELYFNEASYGLELESVKEVYIHNTENIIKNELHTFKVSLLNIEGYENPVYYWFVNDELLGVGEEFSYTFTDSIYELKVGLIADKEGEKNYLCTYFPVSFANEAIIKDSVLSGAFTENFNSPSSINSEFNITDFSKDSVVYALSIKESNIKIPLTDPLFDSVPKTYIITEIVNESNGDFIYEYLVADEESMELLYEEYLELKRRGYDEAKIKAIINEQVKILLAQADSIKETIKELEFIQSENIHPEGDKYKYSIYFGSSKYRLDREDEQIIRKMIKDYKTLKSKIKSLKIEGHTDATNTSAYNKTLSELRVKSVADYILELGVSDDLIMRKGAGEDKPIGDNSTEFGKQLNRRVTVTFIF